MQEMTNAGVPFIGGLLLGTVFILGSNWFYPSYPPKASVEVLAEREECARIADAAGSKEAASRIRARAGGGN